jgi:hypothetical protein
MSYIYECIVKEMHVEKKSKIKQIVVHYSLVPILGDEKRRREKRAKKYWNVPGKGKEAGTIRHPSGITPSL